jgi:hypothetical protein
MTYALGWEVMQSIVFKGGNRLVYIGDIWMASDVGFDKDSTSHTKFYQNIFEWLCETPTGGNIGRGYLWTSPTNAIAAVTAKHSVSSEQTMSLDYATQLAKLREYPVWWLHPWTDDTMGNEQAWRDYIFEGGAACFHSGNFYAPTGMDHLSDPAHGSPSYNLSVGGATEANYFNDLTDYSGFSHPILSGVGDLFFYGASEFTELSASDKTTVFTGDHPTEGDLDLLAVYDGQA